MAGTISGTRPGATTVLDRLGAWVAGEAPDDPRLADHVLDTIGAWLAGSVTEDGQALSGAQGAGALALSTHPLDQLARRVGQTRLTEIDDIHLPTCTTPGSVVVITALTLAGALGCTDARRFAAALRAGYGAMTWLSGVVSGATVFYRGIWPTYYATPIGAAAVTARLLGLDARRTAHALAISLTASSGGIGAPEDRYPRWMLIGQSARLGSVAALSAANGYGGDRSLLDGDWLTRVHGFAIPREIGLPPDDGSVSSLSMKPICAARQTQSAIAAFRQMLQQGAPAGDIVAIEVAVPPKFTGVIDHASIGARMGRITSIGYLLALAAYRPEALGDVARATIVTDEASSALAASVSVVGDAALEQHYPAHWPARVTLQFASGRCLSETVIAAPGDPERRLEGAALVEKFHRLARSRVDATTAERVRAAALAATADDTALAELVSLTASL